MQNFRGEYKIYIHFEDNESNFSFRIVFFFLSKNFYFFHVAVPLAH